MEEPTDNSRISEPLAGTPSLRLPPNNPEAEQSVLGGLMLDNERFDDVVGIVKAEDFYRPDHRKIFRAMVELAEAGQPLDVLTLAEVLERSNDLEDVGGKSVLASMARNTPAASNVDAYAEIVRQQAIRRALIDVAGRITGDAYEPGNRTGMELLDVAEQAIFAVGDASPDAGEPRPVKPLLEAEIERMDKAGSDLLGLSTGFPDLDSRVLGLQGGDLTIVAGRPSMGKTAFAMNIVESALLQDDARVLVFSMEMSASALVQRLIASLGQVDHSRVRNGQLDDNDWSRIETAATKLRDRQLLIDDSPALTPTELRSRTRRARRAMGGLDLVTVDYLQLMQVPGRSDNRIAEVSEISRRLKSLARELEVPVVALSQLNRGPETRVNHRPVMADLRESGAIEQDADLILFIYRDEVYNKEQSTKKGLAEIIIGKQRHGPVGTIELAFLARHTRFQSLDRDEYSGYRPPEDAGDYA